MGLLILLRHGQSQWNLENRFTGFVDVPLSPKGEEEAKLAGRLLSNYPLDRVFTSVLKRAIDTASLALLASGHKGLVPLKDAALNERHYGDLQGLNKDDMRAKYGEEQVKLWRRSFRVRPPQGESLEDTCNRVIPYLRAQILPPVLAGENVLVVAHGNSLRGIIKELEQVSDEGIVSVEIPTGVPIVYELDAAGHVLSKKILEDGVLS